MSKEEYLGGHPTAGFSGEGDLILSGSYYPNELKFHKSFLKNFYIPYENIILATAITEEQVSKNVTLTRMLLVGIYAFSDSLKKKKVEKSHYLTIDCIIDGIPCSLLFKCEKAHSYAARINEFAAKRKAALGQA